MYKVLLLVVAIFLWSGSCINIDTLQSRDDFAKAFVSFVSQYEKVYSSYAEVDHRFEVFQNGIKLAQQLNEKSKIIGGATYGITKFSDLTPEEFKEMYLMKQFNVDPELLNDPKHKNVSVTGSVLAGAFDWTSKGVVTGVYDQGACGSCWAFSATENFESAYAIKYGALKNLSPQQIVSCDGNYGCNGGSPTQAWTYIFDQGGLDTWQCYPYVGVAQACRYNSGCVGATLNHWNWIYQNDETNMANWLAQGAPISVCLDAANWQYYTGGVVLEAQCPTTPQSDHCVLITGFNLNTNPGYWHIRNSWGTAWGEQGYIRLQWGANTCGVAYYPASVTGL